MAPRLPINDDVGHLFAIATARLEDAHDIALRGQSPRLTAKQRLLVAKQLLRALARCVEEADRVEAAVELANGNPD